MTQARRITFGFSHFCEKARWALDWHGIAYQEIGWPPGVHRILAKHCGAKGTTLPILLDGGMVIEGSGAIIDWAETKAQDCTRSLTPQANLSESQEIERRADEVIGVHVRSCTLTPRALATDVERWRTRPVMRWVIAQYRAHRTPTSSLTVRL